MNEIPPSVCPRAEFQTQSSARIQLSRVTELFPGTNDRIMLISGSVNQVLTALHLVLAKMAGEKVVLETMMARCALRAALHQYILDTQQEELRHLLQ